MTDESLRQAFEALRTSEAAQTPRFAKLWQARAVTPRRRSWAVAFATMLLIVVITATVRHRPRQTARPTVTISTWRAPTDFLLKTPGQELLRSTPDLKGKLQ